MGMNPDTAYVIISATEIFITVMKTAHIQKIMASQIDLSD